MIKSNLQDAKFIYIYIPKFIEHSSLLIKTYLCQIYTFELCMIRGG